MRKGGAENLHNFIYMIANAASAFYGFVVNDQNGEFFNKAGTRVPLDDKQFRQHEYSFFVQDS